MKLKELYTKSIQEVMESMEMVDLKVHSDNAGNVKGIEAKFIDKEEAESIEDKKDRRDSRLSF